MNMIPLRWDGAAPADSKPGNVIDLRNYRWEKYFRELFWLPVAAGSGNSPGTGGRNIAVDFLNCQSPPEIGIRQGQVQPSAAASTRSRGRPRGVRTGAPRPREPAAPAAARATAARPGLRKPCADAVLLHATEQFPHEPGRRLRVAQFIVDACRRVHGTRRRELVLDLVACHLAAVRSGDARRERGHHGQASPPESRKTKQGALG